MSCPEKKISVFWLLNRWFPQNFIINWCIQNSDLVFFYNFQVWMYKFTFQNKFTSSPLRTAHSSVLKLFLKKSVTDLERHCTCFRNGGGPCLSHSAAPRAHLWCSHHGGRGGGEREESFCMWWAGARLAAQHPVQETVPSTKNYPASNANNAKAKKPRFKQLGLQTHRTNVLFRRHYIPSTVWSTGINICWL